MNNNPSLRAARAFGAAVLAGGVVTGVGSAQAQTIQTPRDADGHPVLAGLWGATGVGGIATEEVGDVARQFRGRGNSYVGLEADGALRRVLDDNVPPYKPEYWDQITEKEYMGNWEDPQNLCWSYGVPRLGAPRQIVKVEGQPAVILFYSVGPAATSRWIWTDGREHDRQAVAAETFNGEGIGHWEGDSLVIEAIGFSDTTWLHKNGWVHGFKMKVTERLTRVGNSLVWEATVEDPDYFTQPWRMTPIVVSLNARDPNGYVHEPLPCLVGEPLVSHTRSG